MIGAGGTGGHVYPALTAAEALHRHDPDNYALHFVGTVGGFEQPLVQQSGIPFAGYHAVYAGPLHGVNILRMVGSLLKLFVGFIQSLILLLTHRPGVLLLTGGWANVPLAVAAWILRVPSVIYLPDIEPALTINVLKRFAQKVAITVPASEKYFRKGQTVVTGYPLRQSLLEATREKGIRYFDLDPQHKTLLVFGGSRGARSINIAVIDILPQLFESGLQVVHVTGELDWERVQEQAGPFMDHAEYHAFPYLHSEDMGLAFAAADMVICRSGASTLGELPYFGLAAILVPYPYAWRYQKVNADYLTERGAAIRMDDEEMATQLLPAIKHFMEDEAYLSDMQAKSKALAQGDGADQLARLLVELAGGQPW